MKVTETLANGTVIVCDTTHARVSAIDKVSHIAYVINFNYGIDALEYFNRKAYSLRGGECLKH